MRSRPTVRQRSEWGWAYLFILPNLLGLTIFYLWPVLRTFFLSFTTVGPFGGAEWSGLNNYVTLTADSQFWQTLQNTILLSVIGLLGIPIALGLASLLSTPGLRFMGAYRVIYFLPVVTMPVAVGIVWKNLYKGDFGLVNQALSVVGIDGPKWLTDPNTAIVAIALVAIWMALGTQIVIFIAAIQGVPRELYEAACLDGAGKIRQFWSVTLPMVTPSIFFVSVISVIGSLQTFDLIFVMTDETNPAHPFTNTIVSYFYQRGFVQNEAGYAAAIAFVLLIVIGAVTLLQFRLQKRWVHYV